MSDQASTLRAIMDGTEKARRASVINRSANHHGGAASFISPPHVPSSIPTGMVSYGPICSRVPKSEARLSLLRAHRLNEPLVSSLPRLARAIAVTSGKGGVGKSNLAVNLAVAMSQLGLKICLLDADMGLANADVLCNLSPRLTLEHVVSGGCRLTDAMLLAPGGFRLIPGASGVTRLADLNPEQRRTILEQLAALEQVADVILIDCGAGISANVVAFAAAAHSMLVVTTPEPTAITDGYGMIKTLVRGGPVGAIDSSIQIVVNLVANDDEALQVFQRIDRVSRTFLNRPLQFGGAVPADAAVCAAVRQRMPFVLRSPDCPATAAMRDLAMKLAKQNGLVSETTGSDDITDRLAVPDKPSTDGFFTRLAVWLGVLEYVD